MQTQVVNPPRQTAPVLPVTAPPVRHRSPLGQITVSVAVLAVGVLAIVDLSGINVAPSAYPAAMLSIVGFGLLAGAWYGRARWLIAVGAGLSILLAIAAAAEAIGPANAVATWRPATVNEIESTYHVDLGNATLDLTGVKFAGYEKAVAVTVGAGNLTVVVPPEVDVRAEARVDMGNASVFGTRWGGMGQSARTVLDEGTDGPGGGLLTLRAGVDMGNLEVKR